MLRELCTVQGGMSVAGRRLVSLFRHEVRERSRRKSNHGTDVRASGKMKHDGGNGRRLDEVYQIRFCRDRRRQYGDKCEPGARVWIVCGKVCIDGK